MVDSEHKDAMGLDPHQLLRALGSLLDSQGGAKGIPEILRIASLMKDARKLVARCVYANILKCTKSDDIMTKFVQAGGWETLNIWLQDAKAIENTAFISELLDVYQNVPVTIDLLKQNNCAKTIKQMSKSGDTSLVKPCSDLVDRWMKAIKLDSQSNKDKASDSSKKEHKHSSSEKSKHSEKSHSKEDSEKSHSKNDKSHQKSSSHISKSSSHSDKSRSHSRNHSEKSKHHHSSASDKSNSDKNVDKAKSRTNSLDNRRDSDSSVTSQTSVTSAKVGEKRNSTTTSAFGSILSSADENSDVKKAKVSTKDSANKAKTAKTAPTKFRSTGLEQESVLPPSKKKKPIENKIPVKRPSPLPKPKEQPPEKKSKSSPSGPTGKDKVNSLATTTEETHGKIKIIPPKPKPVEMFESSGFMDAIGASIVPQVPKIKRKKATPPSVNTQKASAAGAPGNTSPTATSPDKVNTSPTSPPRDKGLPSFYKDTLASPTEKSVNLSSAEQPGGDAKEGAAENDAEAKDETKSNDDVTSVAGSEISTESSVKDGGGKKKKHVTWAAEKDLKSFFYFELDETERVNVNKVKNFEEIKKQEMAMERMRLENIKREAASLNAGHIPWRPLVRISGLPEPLSAPGVNSTERDTQKAREESVLQALYFNKLAIPHSPAEADPEEVPYEEPKIMPLEDDSGESVIDHTVPETGSTDETANTNAQFSLTPEVATLLQSMAQQVNQSKGSGNDAMNGSTGNAAALMPSAEELANLPPDMQNMIQSFLGSKDQGSKDELIDNIKGILSTFQGGAALPQGFAAQFQAPAPGQGLLATPPMYGSMMHPPPPMPPHMHGPPPPMAYGPPGHNMYGRPPLLGPAPMRGGPMRGLNRPRGRQRQICRHFQAGKCQRSTACGFLHPGVNGPY